MCVAPLLPQEEAAPKPWMDLPDDPIGRLWASVDDSTVPWRPEGEATLTWDRWAEALSTLTPLDSAAPIEPPTQVQRRDATEFLVRFAVEDERPEDAFRWLAGLGADDPEALAGLLPLLFPGVPADTALLPGGHLPPLPAEVMLRPQLPPMPRSEAARRLSRRATCRGIVIGESTVDLILKVDGSGVVAEFIHRGGPAVTLIVQLPRPDGMRLKELYVDWDRQAPPEGSDPKTFDWASTPIKFTIQPQPTGEDAPGYAESFSVFARLGYVSGGIPRTPPGALPHALSEGGLELVVDAPTADVPDALPWMEIAAAWEAACGLPVKVSTGAPVATSTTDAQPIRGTSVVFQERPDPKLLARQITGAIEERRRQDHLLYR